MVEHKPKNQPEQPQSFVGWHMVCCPIVAGRIMGKEGRDWEPEENCVSVNSESRVETQRVVPSKPNVKLNKTEIFFSPQNLKLGLFIFSLRNKIQI